ncbi:MAG TPA: CHASE2 domain-containing protein, partial [Rectinemataceae bacterium]|nr:CHASE2 domain-containing protein [Rectinemataceae bacterium]
MKKPKGLPEWSIPFAALALVAGLAIAGLSRPLELRIRDLYTRLVPGPLERPELVLVDVDDLAMQRVGQWPWSRDIHAGFLADLRSLGADSLSFDVEFVDRGPVGVTSREREATLAAKTTELEEVFQALGGRQIRLPEAEDYAKTILHDGVYLTARDNDTFLGQAMAVFGRAYTTLNFSLRNDSEDSKA